MGIRKIGWIDLKRNIMMITSYAQSENQNNAKALISALDNGWVLDPMFSSKPIRLDNAVVYHLVKYTEEERAALKKLEEEALLPEKERRVIDRVKSSDQEEIRTLLQQGWVIINEWAKETLLYRYETDAQPDSKKVETE